MDIKSSPLTDLVRILCQRFREDRCTQVASSLTFTSLLALVPIITVALTVVSAFPVFQSWIGHLQRFLVHNVVPESVSSITTYAGQFSENSTQLTAVGIAFVAITALVLMITIDGAFNAIWRIARPRGLVQRILVYWAVLTVGPLFLGASLSLTSYLIRLSLGLIDNPPGAALLMVRFVSLALTSVALSLLYWTVPNRPVFKRDALIGGVSAGICLEAMKHGFSFYIAHFPTYKLVYGAFAAVPFFLLWIYLSWLIVIGGAVLAALLPEWRERAGQSAPVPGSDFFDALQVMQVLWRAHQAGTIVSLAQLHPAVSVRVDHLEQILTALAGAGWIARARGNGWILSRDAAVITVAEIYRMFVFNAAARAPARHAGIELESLAHDISARIDGNLQMSLAQMFGRMEQPAGAATVPGLKVV